MSLPDGFRLPGDRADLERRVTEWSRSVGLPEGWLRLGRSETAVRWPWHASASVDGRMGVADGRCEY